MRLRNFITSLLISVLLLTGCSQPTSTETDQAASPSPSVNEELNSTSQDIKSFSSPAPSATPAQNSQTTSQVLGNQTTMVTAVIDGDTIEIEDGQRIRYIGIN